VPVDPKEVRVSGLMCYMDCLLTITYIHLQKSKQYKQGRSCGGRGVPGCFGCPRKQNPRGGKMAEKL